MRDVTFGGKKAAKILLTRSLDLLQKGELYNYKKSTKHKCPSFSQMFLDSWNEDMVASNTETVRDSSMH
jgi:hypothetical protein